MPFSYVHTHFPVVTYLCVITSVLLFPPQFESAVFITFYCISTWDSGQNS